MAKHAAAWFEDELDELFRARTHWIRTTVRGGKAGRPPIFDRHKVTKVIESLQDHASICLAKDCAQYEFEKLVNKKRGWHVTASKGWGRDAKRRNFDTWFERKIPFRNCIYLFWADSTCLYVGRTVHGKGRPQAHFEKYWFSRVSRIDVYSTSKASEVPKLECLAIHRFNPTENRRKASKKKWTQKCPVCEVHQWIHDELRDIFALRK